jgi:O-antigen/teichoic acid export membrane protein
MVNDSLRLISFVTAVVALTSVVFSREIITLLFSETYAISSPAFALLMIAFHMTFVLSLMGYTLTAAGYPGRALGENVIRTGLTLLGDLLLIPAFGFMGPVYAGLIGRYVANPVAAWLLRRSGVALAIGPYAKQTVLLLLGAGLFWWLQLDEFIFKIAIVVLFVGLNLALSTVSPGDLRLLLPRTMTKRLGVPSEL